MGIEERKTVLLEQGGVQHLASRIFGWSGDTAYSGLGSAGWSRGIRESIRSFVRRCACPVNARLKS